MAKKSKYFDTDSRPIGNVKPVTADAIKPISRRRRYAHDFSAGRQLKRIMNTKGRAVWRRVPDSAIVFYGKRDSVRRTKTISPLGKTIYKSEAD